MEDLQITVGADISSFKKGMDETQKELAKTALAAGKLDSTLKRGTLGINQAGNALQNLGRVAQDAPFGFIGIQNNLNPLLESFQRLRQEAGSNVGALKAFAKSLAGAGGIGFALSVVSSIIVKYPNLFNAYTDAQIRAMAVQKEFNTEMSKAAASAETEAVSIHALVAVAQNDGLSRKARLGAIKELQSEYPQYLSNINLENINSVATTDAINGLTAALGRKAKAQALTNLLTKENEKLFTLQNGPLADNVDILDAIGNSYLGLGSVAASSIKLAGVAQKNLAKDTKSTIQNIADLEKKINDLTHDQAVSGDLGLSKPGKPKAVKDIETIKEVLAKLRHDIEVNNVSGDLLGFDKSKENIALISSAIDKLVDKFKDSGERKGALITLGVELDERQLAERLKERTTGIGDVAKIEIPLDLIPPKPSELKDTIKQITVPITDQMLEMTDLLKGTFLDLAGGIGESLGEALTGGGSFLKDALGGIFDIMGTFLIKLGKAAIETSALFAAIKASKSNPITGVIGGIVAIAAGTLLKNIELPGFASGGYVSGPGSSTSDSINARLSRGEYVVKADSVTKFGKSFLDMINGGGFSRNNNFATGGMVSGNIGGGQLITVEVVGKLAGTDMYLQNKRTALKIGRNT